MATVTEYSGCTVCCGGGCCPCTADDGRIVEINMIPSDPSKCSLTGQFSMNSSGPGCLFLLDGLNDGDCQILGGGSIECSPDGSFSLAATTGDGVDPATETDWSTGMTLTVNSCDPLDLEWNGTQGTVTAVEVP